MIGVLSRFDFGPVLIVKLRDGADIAHEFAMDQGCGVGKDGGTTEEPGFDIFPIVSIGSVKTGIVHEESAREERGGGGCSFGTRHSSNSSRPTFDIVQRAFLIT